MKILLVTGRLGYRGTAKALYGYAMILMRNHDVRVWEYDDDSSPDDEHASLLRNHGLVVHMGHRCLNEALAFKPDVINLHRPGIPRQRDLDVFIPFKKNGARCIETNVFGRVDPTIADIVDTSIQVSRWDLWQWSKWTGAGYPVRGAYCPNPIDCSVYKRISTQERDEVRKSWGIPDGARVMGRIGNTDWAALKKPLLSVFANDGNAFVVHVEDHSNKLPECFVNHPRVRCIPRISGAQALSRFYSACDVMVSMSTIGESFGYVNAEAMLCGTPVIALSTPLHCNAQSEMVEPGVCGLTIANPAALSRAYKMLFSDGMHDCLSTRCRESILRRFSYEACAPLLEMIMQGNPELTSRGALYDDASVKELLSGAIGDYGWGTHFLFRLYYTPAVFGMVAFIKEKMYFIINLLRRVIR